MNAVVTPPVEAVSLSKVPTEPSVTDILVANPVVEFARDQLLGKLLEVCVAQMKAQNVWDKIDQFDQQVAINRMTEQIGNAVLHAVLVISTDRRPAIGAVLDQVVFKDNVKATISLSNSEAAHELADVAGGGRVYIVLTEDYSGGASKVTPTPDQPELALGPPAVPAEIRGDAAIGFTIWRGDTNLEPAITFALFGQAQDWLTKYLTDEANGVTTANGPDTEPVLAAPPAPTPPPPANDGQPIIEPFEDGYVVKDGFSNLMCGGRKFADHAAAETWLKEFLGVGKDKADGAATGGRRKAKAPF